MSRKFLGAFLSYLLRGRLAFPGGHRPPSGHLVSSAFAGVGVAAAEDPAVDDWIVTTLRGAGIDNVRLDFTYGDAEKPAGRLLRRLLAEDFKVVLHLMQPADAARDMPSQVAAERWRLFLISTLDAFGASVSMIEVASTINRRRWSGYSLEGFLAAWEIAWQEVKSRKLLLAGPSVTDFEPPWSVGVLSLLQQRKRLPDVHTDNLFAERATEPERDDPKVLGPRLAGWLRMNLVKKARVLQRIGADFGVPRLFSPAAFWTLPRIERLLPAGPQKQADYLTRYMVLAAASGALEGAWWGPLICQREGLVDDGAAYPALERITHYASVSGRLEDFRVRPALAALREFSARIPGQRYVACLASGEGLEIHAFTNVTGGLTHVAWTINGRAAACVDVYPEGALHGARFYSRDGTALADPPSLLTESPLYIEWPEGDAPVLKSGAGVLAGVVVDVHGGQRLHYFRADGWHGIVVAASAEAARKLLVSVNPASLQVQRDAVLRHARNAVWTIDNPWQASARLVVKQPAQIRWDKRLFDRFKPTKGLRSWNGTCELQRRGIGAAPPVAWFEKPGDTTLRQNYYLCEFVASDYSVRQAFTAFSDGCQVYAGMPAEAFYRHLSSFLLRLHGSGIFFRDLSGGNLLVRHPAGGNPEFLLIDTGRIRVYPTALPVRMRLADLVRVCNKLHWAGREQFLSFYFSGIGRSMTWIHRLAFLVYDLKVDAKRKIGRKALRKIFRR